MFKHPCWTLESTAISQKKINNALREFPLNRFSESFRKTEKYTRLRYAYGLAIVRND